MTEKDISTICWWIPFKKTRNAVKSILYKKLSEELNLLRLHAKIGFSCPENLPVLKEFRETKLIVSLTTFPERDFEVDVVVYSLLMQSLLPDKIIIWLSYEEYPDGEDSIPHYLKVLRKYGVEIMFCKNIRSYKKLIPALQKYPNDIIVTVDDDAYYQTNCLKYLYDAYIKQPNCIHSHLVSQADFDTNGNLKKYSNWKAASTIPSLKNFAVGIGGVLYPPNCLYKDICKEDIFMKICSHADDIWFWAMAVLNGTKINIIENHISKIIELGFDRNYKKLLFYNWHEGGNDKQLKNIMEYYPEIKEKLMSETS